MGHLNIVHFNLRKKIFVKRKKRSFQLKIKEFFCIFFEIDLKVTGPTTGRYNKNFP